MKWNWRNLQFIFMPAYWIMVTEFDEPTDKFINLLLTNPKFSDLNAYTVKLHGIEIWIENRPYGGVTLEESRNFRPSRLTIKKFYKELDNYRYKLLEEKYNNTSRG